MRVRWLLSVSLLGFVAVLLVGLLSGSADSTAAQKPLAKSADPVPVTGEVPGLRTAYSRTYRRADGSRVAKIWSVPVNYRDGSGVWRSIDTTLRGDGRGGFDTAASPATVALPQNLDGTVRVSDGSRSVSMVLDGARAESVARVAGNSAVYDGVLSGVQAQYTALAGGLKETLVVTDHSAPSRYTFRLAASDGLQARLADDGSVQLRDNSGGVRFWLPAPTVQAANEKRASTDHVRFALSDDGRSLAVVVDQRWLAAAALPVKVDPSVWLGGTDSCTLASGSLATTSDCNGSTLKVGHDSSHTYRAALRFGDLASAVPRTASIMHATLALSFLSQTQTGGTPTLSAPGLKQQLGAGATWTAYNGVSAWTSPGGDYLSGGDDPQANAMQMNDAYLDGWVTWDVSALAEKWVRDPNDNKGVLVKADDETATDVLTFGGATHTGANTGGPTLEVDYELHPGVERGQSYETVGIDDRSSLQVNVTSGNVMVSGTDVHLAGRNGMDLDIGRTFNGQDLGNGLLFGSAWSDSINRAATRLHYDFTDAAAMLTANGGAIYRFDRDYRHDSSGTWAYVTPPGIDADLSMDTSTNEATLRFRRTGTTWSYGAPQSGDTAMLSDIKDSHGNAISIAYRSGSPATIDHITDSFGHQIDFSYASGSDKLTKITGASGRHWDYTVDDSSGHALLTAVANAAGKTTSYTYATGDPDVWDKLTKVTDARGNDIELEYGPDGDYSQVTKITRVVDGGSQDVSWQFDYTPDGSVGHSCTGSDAIGRTVETDPRGKQTTYCYNSSGQVIQAWDALGRQTDTSYTASANVASFTGLAGTANQALTTYTFSTDGNDNPTGSVGAAGETSKINYCDGSGQPSCSSQNTDGTNPGPLAKYRPISTQDPQDTKQAFEYNSSGDLTKLMDGAATRSLVFDYNSDGTIKTSKDGKANQTSYGYNSAGQLTAVTPPSAGNPSGYGSADKGQTTLTYDAVGRVATVTDGRGKTATVTYDGQDRTTRVDWTGGAWMTFAYDDNGNLTQREDSAGNTTVYGYDKLNRRISETFPSSRTDTYGYDKASNLASLTDDSGTTTYTYDDINRVASITSPKPGGGTDTVTYGYSDNSGVSGAPRQQTITFPNSSGGAGLKQELNSDLSGKLVQAIIRNSSGSVLKSLAYNYTQAGKSRSLIQSVTDQAGARTDYSYTDTGEDVGHLLAATTYPSGSSTASESFSYAYDLAGNRTRISHTVGSTTTMTRYAYNALNQLCWSTTSASAGSCTTGGTIPSDAQMLFYDAAGQRTSHATVASPTPVVDYTYDNLGRLTDFAGTTAGYLSPGNGELVTLGSTDLQDNMLGLARQIPSSGSAVAYTRAPNGAPISQRTISSKQNLFTDVRGSIIAMADDGANAIARSYSYDPDGNATTTGTGATTDLQYIGGHKLPNGLYHYGARYYNPNNATWTQPDPINQVASLVESAPYAYAGGDPINRVDLLGLYDRELLRDAGESCLGGAAEGGGTSLLAGQPEAAPEAAIAGCGVGVVTTVTEHLTRKNFGDTVGDVVRDVNIAHDAYKGAEDLVDAVF